MSRSGFGKRVAAEVLKDEPAVAELVHDGVGMRIAPPELLKPPASSESPRPNSRSLHFTAHDDEYPDVS